MNVQINFGVSLQQNFFYLDNFGCIGVDLFFVISGFKITYVASNRGVHQGSFCRINPISYLAMLIYLAVTFIWLHLANHSIGVMLKELGLEISDSLLIVPISDNINSMSSLLIVGVDLKL